MLEVYTENFDSGILPEFDFEKKCDKQSADSEQT